MHLTLIAASLIISLTRQTYLKHYRARIFRSYIAKLNFKDRKRKQSNNVINAEPCIIYRIRLHLPIRSCVALQATYIDLFSVGHLMKLFAKGEKRKVSV
jgi:hypothetical protein